MVLSACSLDNNDYESSLFKSSLKTDIQISFQKLFPETELILSIHKVKFIYFMKGKIKHSAVFLI